MCSTADVDDDDNSGGSAVQQMWTRTTVLEGEVLFFQTETLGEKFD